MLNRITITTALVALLGLVFVSAHAAQRMANPRGFDGPPAVAEAASTLKSIQERLAAGQTAQAGEIEQLLADHLDELAGIDQGLISSYAFIESLSPPAWKLLSPEYQRQYEPAAKAALETVRRNSAARPEDYYAVARRYAPTSAALWACVDAGDRAIALGDAAAAEALYGRAQRLGWKSDDDRAITSAVGRLLNGQPAGPLAPAVSQRLGDLPGRLAGFRGVVTFDAQWFRREMAGLPRFFPTAGDGVIYLNSASQAMAFKDGKVLWRWTSNQAWVKAPIPQRVSGRGTGQSFVPAVLWAATGSGQIVVSRQSRGGTGDWCLRAFRAADGKLLWATDASIALDNLSFTSSPTIAGRYVYALAVDFSDDPQLVVAALDVLSGQLFFKTVLGPIPQLRGQRNNANLWEPIWEPSTITVDGLEMFVAPNVGQVFSIGRLDGKIRWMQTYKEFFSDGPPQRWRNAPQVCGQMILVAPADTVTLIALDRGTGKPAWSTDTMPADTLIGGWGSAALLAGSSISAIDAQTRTPRWQYQPSKPHKFTGPASVVGPMVFVPTTEAKVQSLAADTGRPMDSAVKHPNFRQVMGAEGTRKALEEAMILGTLGTTPAKAGK